MEPPSNHPQKGGGNRVPHLSGSRSWFEGTMEVISGMAPRPSTPQPGAQHSQHHAARSMSAPNSPARPGYFPGINRLPSQDSLDRSIHNESGHGKSTAQIIKDLKQANASLSAKTASMEAKFMNQMSEATRQFQERQRSWEERLRKKERQLSQLETYKNKTQDQLKEKDNLLSKIKEESAFQRHTISDLKSQLYQLQSEMEESDKILKQRDDEYDQVVLDNKDMLREIKMLQQQVREGTEAKTLVSHLRSEVQEAKSVNGRDAVGNAEASSSPNTTAASAVKSSDSDGGNNEKPQQMLQQLEQTQNDLEDHRTRLTAAQDTLRDLRTDKEEQSAVHRKQLEELETQLLDTTGKWKTRELELLEQIEGLEFTDSQVVSDLRLQIESRDEEISVLRDDLRKLAAHSADLEDELAKAQHDATNQEQYRRDEVEDLRVLHDAQEVEIHKMRKRLDDAERELELRDEELDEKDREILDRKDALDENDKLRSEVEMLQAKLDLMQLKLEDLEDEKDHRMEREQTSGESPEGETQERSPLQDEIEDAHRNITRLENELQDMNQTHKNEVNDLRSSVDMLNESRIAIEERCQKLSDERDSAQSAAKEASAKVVSAEAARRDTEQELHRLKAELDEIQTSKGAAETQELEELRTLRAQLSQQIGELQEQLKKSDAAANERQLAVKHLESQLEASRSLQDEVSALKEEIDNLQQQLKTSKDASASTTDSENEINKLKDAVSTMETASTKTKKQLREAQIALVALDDEKKKVSTSKQRLIVASEKKRESLQKELDSFRLEKSQLESAFEKERKALQKQIERLEASANTGKESTKKSLTETALTIEKLKAESDLKLRALKNKLKDRDTTISALVKSSVTLEDKISELESELDELRSVQESNKSRTTLSNDTEAKLNNDIASLRKQLTLAKADVRRWKQAVRDDETPTSEYRYQISTLQKELDESNEKLSERDDAIEKLVTQSMSQDGKIKSLKSKVSKLQKEIEVTRVTKSRYDEETFRAEVRRLKQESEIFAGQIIEQDEEIEILKTRIVEKDDEVASLRNEVTKLKEERDDRESMQPEVDDLKMQLYKREDVIADLEQTVADLKATPKADVDSQQQTRQIINLQAEIDELNEANRENRKELGDIRRQLWDAKDAAGKANDLKIELDQALYALDAQKRSLPTNEVSESLQSDLAEAKAAVQAMSKQLAEVESLKMQLRTKNNRIENLEAKAAVANEAQIMAFQEEISSLRNEVSSLKNQLDELDAENDALRNALEASEAEKQSFEVELMDEQDKVPLSELQKLQQEKSELLDFNNNMSDQITALKEELEKNTQLVGSSNDLQERIDREREERETAQKSIVETYERQLAALNLNKDVVIDGLRKDLAETRGKSSGEMEELIDQMKALEGENITLREKLEMELQGKDQQIFALEHALHAQEQMLDNVRMEMDQLQSGMEHATHTRRGEVDELQKEVMEIESRAMKQEREIVALKMQLEESKLEHKAEVVRLKETIVTLESESPLAKTVAELQNDDRMLEVRQRLEMLKGHNTSLKEDNIKLGGQLERADIEIKRLQMEMEHAKEVEKDCARLQKQVKHLETFLSGGGRTQGTSARKPKAATTAGPEPVPEKENNSSENEKNSKQPASSPSKQKSKAKSGFGLFKRGRSQKRSDAPSAESKTAPPTSKSTSPPRAPTSIPAKTTARTPTTMTNVISSNMGQMEAIQE